MSIEELIKEKILQNLNVTQCEVINESAKHKGHVGDDGSGQTHFKLMVVSSDFEGLSPVARQRLVNSIINPLFDKGLHAISMRLIPEK